MLIKLPIKVLIEKLKHLISCTEQVVPWRKSFMGIKYGKMKMVKMRANPQYYIILANAEFLLKEFGTTELEVPHWIIEDLRKNEQ